MGFHEERQMVEQALGSGHEIETNDLPYPPAARRFIQARETLGLTQDDVAALWGEQASMYGDLELLDSEVFEVISVQQIVDLASVLRTSPLVLLFGEDSPAPLPLTTYAEVVARLRAKMTNESISMDELGDRVGWDLVALLEDPTKLADLPIFGLHRICAEVGVDWATILSNVAARRRHDA